MRRHAVLRRVGMYFHGDDVDEVVPPLQSRSFTRTAQDEGEEPADNNT